MLGTAFCTDTAPVFQFIGFVVLIFKIIIPVILIVLGVISLGKAVLDSDDKKIKDAAMSLIKKFIVAVVIFLLPTIIGALFNFINGWSDLKNDYNVCANCIKDPNGSSCKSAVSKAG